MLKQMKLIVALLMVCVLMVGCGANKTSNESNVESETSSVIEEEEVESVEEVEYPELIWPTTGISKNLPKTDWMVNGEIEYDVNEAFSANVGNVTASQFREYVILCQDAGFTDIRANDSKHFTAFNADGLSVYVEYREGNVLHIWIG